MSDAKKITLYGADWCSDCTRSKGYLDAHQVPYTYVDVDADAAAKGDQGSRDWQAAQLIGEIPIDCDRGRDHRRERADPEERLLGTFCSTNEAPSG